MSGDAVFGNGDRLTLTFDRPTNVTEDILEFGSESGLELPQVRERERGKYERDDAENCLDFCLFSFRAPAAVPRVSACSFELTTERKKERKKFCADLLIYDETSAFKLLVEG